MTAFYREKNLASEKSFSGYYIVECKTKMLMFELGGFLNLL